MSFPELEPINQAAAEKVRARATAAYRAAGFGDPPARQYDESVTRYRTRLVEGLRHLSPTWGKLNQSDVQSAVRAGALDVVEAQVFADAEQSVKTDLGTLREISEPDITGRKITRFVGSDTACWAPFQFPTMRGRINRAVR